MNRNLGVLALVGLMLIVVTVKSDDNNKLWKEIHARSEVIEGTNRYSTKLIKDSFERTHGNAVFAPAMTRTMLVMLSLGAWKSTKYELNSVINFKNTPFEKIGRESLYNRSQNTKNMEIGVVRTFFFNKTTKINSNFLDMIRHVEMQSVDFSKVNETHKLINKLADQQSESFLKNFMPKAQFNSSFRMLVATGAHLRGIWSIPFAEETAMKPFYMLDGTTRDVEMMHAEGVYSLGYLSPDYSARIIKIDYKWETFESSINTYLIMPEEGFNFNDVEQNLYNFDFRNFEMRDMAKLNLWMPKFKINSTWNLEKPLRKMGLNGIWSNHSDFSEMSDEPFFVNQFFHKASITIDPFSNEKTRSYIAPEGPATDVYVNRPFFLVTVSNNDLLIFFTRVVNPMFY